MGRLRAARSHRMKSIGRRRSSPRGCRGPRRSTLGERARRPAGEASSALAGTMSGAPPERASAQAPQARELLGDKPARVGAARSSSPLERSLEALARPIVSCVERGADALQADLCGPWACVAADQLSAGRAAGGQSEELSDGASQVEGAIAAHVCGHLEGEQPELPVGVFPGQRRGPPSSWRGGEVQRGACAQVYDDRRFVVQRRTSCKIVHFGSRRGLLGPRSGSRARATIRVTSPIMADSEPTTRSAESTAAFRASLRSRLCGHRGVQRCPLGALWRCR